MTPPKKDKTVAIEATLADSHPIDKTASASAAQTAAHSEDEESLRAKGQRWTSILWETTQATIALLVTGTGMYTAAQLALRNDEEANAKSMAITAFLLISNTVFLVIGFYFGRTNHQRVGGVGGDQTGQTR